MITCLDEVGNPFPNGIVVTVTGGGSTQTGYTQPGGVVPNIFLSSGIAYTATFTDTGAPTFTFSFNTDDFVRDELGNEILDETGSPILADGSLQTSTIYVSPYRVLPTPFVFLDEESNPLPPGVLVSVATQAVPNVSLASGFIGVGGAVPIAVPSGGSYVASFVGTQAPTVTQAFTLATTQNAPTVTVTPALSPTMAASGYVATQGAVYPLLRASNPALAPGGYTYALFKQEAAARANLDTQQQFAQALQRLQTSPGLAVGGASAVDLWAADFLGSFFPRAAGESDANYITRIIARLTVPLTTIAAIQLMVDFYLEAFANVLLLEGPVGLDTTGAFDTSGGLDGGINYAAQLPAVTVFDAQTNPALAAAVGIAPPQFCVLFGPTTSQAAPGWYLGDPADSFLGVDTYLGQTVEFTVTPAPSAQLDALIRSVKAGGTLPVYAISNT